MNPLDIFVVAILVTLGLLGFYQGFLRSALGVSSFFLSWLLALWIANPIAALLQNTERLTSAMLYYIEGSEFVHGAELAKMDVAQLSPTQLSDIVANITTPFPVESLVEQNLVSQVFVTETTRSVGSTITQTVVAFSIHVIAFVIAFVAIRLLLEFLIKGYDNVVHLPVLRRADAPIGAIFGLLNGFFLLFVIFMAVPLILIVLSQQGENAALNLMANQLISESRYAEFFYRSNFLLTMMKGVF